MISIRERISLIRNTLRDQGKTQADVAAEMDVYPAKISSILNGKTPSMWDLLQLIKHSGHDLKKIFPTLESDLRDITSLLEKNENEDALVSLINLLDLTKHYESEADSEATR